MSHKKGKDDVVIVNYRDSGWLRDAIRDVSKRSTAQQLAIGGLSGWVSGYLCIKVGKLAAITLGTSILVLQIAQHQGYVKVDWTLFQKDVERAKNVIESQTRTHYPGVYNSVMTFFKNNVYLGGSFAGGFLIGATF
ncbi:FUN14 domain-containing protein 1-like [Ostrea edulis]|uniref:FUN14 domain-containing protein 1-like n=1 Tax=Ostrea edulis TaxID=37623 RepID=UPI0024AEE212|nr:FUN14 domain-containing protein 1-like [Ostrea edulis]